MRISDWSSDVCSSDLDRHRVEGFAFDAFESEDRQIDRGDDDDSENARFDHLRARRSDKSEALVAVEQSPEPVLRLAESAEAIFADDDGPINDEPEIERPEAHQRTEESRDGKECVSPIRSRWWWIP